TGCWLPSSTTAGRPSTEPSPPCSARLAPPPGTPFTRCPPSWKPSADASPPPRSPPRPQQTSPTSSARPTSRTQVINRQLPGSTADPPSRHCPPARHQEVTDEDLDGLTMLVQRCGLHLDQPLCQPRLR